ncbi:DoxX family protein [Hoeflea sp.]|uniref:DoxX family protein n=1 Tax=Hoeflea sp. TaxID=1940281 RepID=UPI003B52F4DD
MTGIPASDRIRDLINLTGRLLLAFLFFAGAVQKLIDPEPVREMLGWVGLPGWLIWPVAAFDAVAAAGLVLGPGIAIWAIAMAGYCILTSWFHWKLGNDPWQITIVVKNWAIAGGLLVLAANGPGRYALGRTRN